MSTVVLCICRVIVTAVNKSTINLKLDFFNNCFADEFSTRKLSLHQFIVFHLSFYLLFRTGMESGKIYCGWTDLLQCTR